MFSITVAQNFIVAIKVPIYPSLGFGLGKKMSLNIMSLINWEGRVGLDPNMYNVPFFTFFLKSSLRTNKDFSKNYTPLMNKAYHFTNISEMNLILGFFG